MKHIKYLSLLFLLISINCKTDLVGPLENSPGSRDYMWGKDSISNWYSQSIWGISGSDFRIVGYDDNFNGQMMYYNGSKWEIEEFSAGIYPTCIYGFSSQDIWMCSADGSIWHYDGIWKEVHFHRDFHPYDIWGISSRDLYVAGGVPALNNTLKGSIIHYNGSNWEEINIPGNYYSFKKIRKDFYSQNYYIKSEGYDSMMVYHQSIFKFDGKNFTDILNIESRFLDLSVINGRVYFCLNKTIMSYTNNKFETVFEVENNNFASFIFGRGDKDIFLAMKDGIAHYNGIDVQYIYKYSGQMNIVDVILTNKELVILTQNNNKAFIKKGVIR